jgi:uncharacterized membrane protein
MMCRFGSVESTGQSVGSSDSTMEILDKRYALGEINSEEYREKKITLNHQNEKN